MWGGGGGIQVCNMSKNSNSIAKNNDIIFIEIEESKLALENRKLKQKFTHIF